MTNKITKEHLDKVVEEFNYTNRVLAYGQQRFNYYLRQNISYDEISAALSELRNKKLALGIEIDFLNDCFLNNTTSDLGNDS